MKKFLFILAIFIFLLSFSISTSAKPLSDRLSGYILLEVEKNGEAWYVYPKNKRRHFLSRPDDAFGIMRELGLGITNEDLELIPISTDKEEDFAASFGEDQGRQVASNSLRSRLKGMILIQVEENGEAWYVYPEDLKRHYLGRPADAFRIMRELSLGILSERLEEIRGSTNKDYYSYRNTIVESYRGTFRVLEIKISLDNPSLKIYTDTAEIEDCDDGCKAFSLMGYYNYFQGAEVAVNGTYFCPQDYRSCSGQSNYYFWPVYNTEHGKFINNRRIKYLTEDPLVAFDIDNKPYLFLPGREFGSKEKFEAKYGVKLQAAFSNDPALIYNGNNLVRYQKMDEKQRDAKATRMGMGWRERTLYILYVYNANTEDIASVFEVYKVENAINLDGGGSSAFIYASEYIRGPGRRIPNAIIFAGQ